MRQLSHLRIRIASVIWHRRERYETDRIITESFERLAIRYDGRIGNSFNRRLSLSETQISLPSSNLSTKTHDDLLRNLPDVHRINIHHIRLGVTRCESGETEITTRINFDAGDFETVVRVGTSFRGECRVR